MRKSADITKYDPDWQIIRVKVKGPTVGLEDKLKIVSQYYNRNKTVDAWERVVNWLEGLSMGYRSSGDNQAISRIATEISFYNGIKPSAKQERLAADTLVSRLSMYPYSERVQLWRDLFDRNKKWLNKGYRHVEHNEFMDALGRLFVKNRETIPDNVSIEKLEELRKKSATLDNTHKFFF